MTIKTFWQDPYLTELETTVQSVNGNQVSLVETIFYAFSGGQESDVGTIGGHTVLKAEKEGLDIYYSLPDGHGLQEKDSVKVVIDWNRRYGLMRHHFAAELVLELVCKKFLSIQKVGAHIAHNKARIDFAWKGKISPFLQEIQSQAQAIIDANLSIMSAYSDEKRQRRYWKIDGFSSVPCGGTHVKNTGEIGCIVLKRVNPGKGIERIEIFVST